jgi:hypothetical protein
VARYRNKVRRGGPNAGVSIFLVLAGVVLFLANLNLIPVDIHRIWDCWPLVFVASGLSRISQMRSPGAFLLGAVLMVVGIIYTLVNLQLFRVHVRDSSWPLSILFLAVGLAGLARVLDGGSSRFRGLNFTDMPFRNGGFQRASSVQPPDPNVPFLNDHAMMRSINRNLDTQNFEGGKVSAIMGNVEIDLSRCRMADGKTAVYVDVQAVMGGIKLRIPESWRVVWQGENTMGHFDDRTIPPITGASAPQFIVGGSVVMGTVEIDC